MQVGSRYVAAAVNRAAPRSQTKMMRLMTPKMWITVTTIATDQSVIAMMASTYTFLAWRSYCSTTRALSKTQCPGPGSPRTMEVIASIRTTMGEFIRLCRVRAGLYAASASKCQWVAMTDRLGASISTAGCRSLHIFILPVLPRL